MKIRFKRPASGLLALVLLVGLASAQSYYVDAVHGDDANSGTSPADSFRTITQAAVTARVTSVAYNIFYVAPGIYDAALGESFPISINPSSTLYAEGAVLVPGVGRDGLEMLGGEWDLSTVSGLIIHTAERGIVDRARSLRVIDCTLRDCSVGLAVESTVSFGSQGVDVRNSSIEGCDVGILRTSGAGIQLWFDSTIQHCRVGIHSDGTQYSGTIALDGRLLDCGVGILSVAGASVESVRPEGLIARCGIGIHLVTTAASETDFRAQRCTVVDCGVGMAIESALTADSYMRFCILDRNGSDAPFGTGGVSLTNSVAPSGVFPHSTVRTDDPQFVDPAAGDYSLRMGSPAIDIQPPGYPGGNTAATDGDFDSWGGLDAGALSFETLSPSIEAEVGSVAELEVRGPGGSRVILLLRRASTTIGGHQTLYGFLHIGVVGVTRVASTRIAPGSDRASIRLEIPDSPALSGALWIAQALVESSFSPSGYALTNRCYVQIH